MRVIHSEQVYGECKPFSITGSLPCIRELQVLVAIKYKQLVSLKALFLIQDEGYDVQTIGFGKMSTYHANNEFCLLSDFKKG